MVDCFDADKLALFWLLRYSSLLNSAAMNLSTSQFVVAPRVPVSSVNEPCRGLEKYGIRREGTGGWRGIYSHSHEKVRKWCEESIGIRSESLEKASFRVNASED